MTLLSDLNLSTFFSLEDKKISSEKMDIEKAYTKGVYADTPANRKRGRVGMTYQNWSKKKDEQKIL